MGKAIDTLDGKNSLTVRDNRTGKTFTIPYVLHLFRSPLGLANSDFCYNSISDNSIPATAFRSISTPGNASDREEDETDKGLRIADQGFLNTAVIRSEITYINGETGSEHCVFLL
jgi:citrate synthase